jgi:rhodanese-related sulfurtransferase
MEDFVKFITNHWMLGSAFIVVLLLFLMNELRERRTGGPSVSPEEAVGLINHQEGIVLDLRSIALFNEGHIVSSLNIPFEMLEKKLGSLQKNMEKPLILISNSPKELDAAYKTLESKGFKVYLINGGLNAWRAAGLPLTKKS